MKHKLALIFSIAVIVAGGYYAIHQYDTQHHKQVVKEASAKAHAFIAQQKAAYEKGRQDAQLNALKNQCAKDHSTYVAETPAQRLAKGSVSDCNPSLTVLQ